MLSATVRMAILREEYGVIAGFFGSIKPDIISETVEKVIDSPDYYPFQITQYFYSK
jgi:hypothetical protein